MRREIIRLANRLCELLEQCNDEEFVDLVCCSVSSNSYIDEDDYDHRLFPVTDLIEAERQYREAR